jgi:hypothetical protein
MRIHLIFLITFIPFAFMFIFASAETYYIKDGVKYNNNIFDFSSIDTIVFNGSDQTNNNKSVLDCDLYKDGLASLFYPLHCEDFNNQEIFCDIKKSIGFKSISIEYSCTSSILRNLYYIQIRSIGCDVIDKRSVESDLRTCMLKFDLHNNMMYMFMFLPLTFFLMISFDKIKKIIKRNYPILILGTTTIVFLLFIVALLLIGKISNYWFILIMPILFIGCLLLLNLLIDLNTWWFKRKEISLNEYIELDEQT